MYPAPLQKLIEYFLKFPGIGPKQATRFAFFLLKESDGYRGNLARTIAELGKEVAVCKQCYRSIQPNTNTLCDYCANKKRNTEMLMVIEKEIDMENVEKTKQYNGLYHVLGGTLSPLEPSSPEKLHLKELFNRTKTLVETHKNNVEIILATNATAEGDATALYIQRILEPLKIKITRFGRGLTTGSELEYSDPTTITNALTNRK
ncbi:MAG: recombination mediator RecR [bacterium]|nr:recombination mediator RecR [bacterium]